MYTRNGKFTITREGYLVDCDGNHIQGAGGDIQIPTDAAEIAIKNNGNIYADGVLVDTIALSDFTDILSFMVKICTGQLMVQLRWLLMQVCCRDLQNSLM